jgi:PIN domain nuclease of toxin-antitoxin system
MKNDIMIDTHILHWFVSESSALNVRFQKKIEEISENGRIFISAISIWEIALLVRKRRMALSSPMEKWVNLAMSFQNFKMIDLDSQIAIESNNLPGFFHEDPADRIIVATARTLDIPLITADQKILDYAKQGFVKVIE